MLILKSFAQRYLQKLRFPWLAIISIFLFIINVFIIDPIPFIDELLMMCAVAVFHTLKTKHADKDNSQ